MEVAVPTAMIDEETSRMIRQYEENLKMQDELEKEKVFKKYAVDARYFY